MTAALSKSTEETNSKHNIQVSFKYISAYLQEATEAIQRITSFLPSIYTQKSEGIINPKELPPPFLPYKQKSVRLILKKDLMCSGRGTVPNLCKAWKNNPKKEWICCIYMS